MAADEGPGRGRAANRIYARSGINAGQGLDDAAGLRFRWSGAGGGGPASAAARAVVAERCGAFAGHEACAGAVSPGWLGEFDAESKIGRKRHRFDAPAPPRDAADDVGAFHENDGAIRAGSKGLWIGPVAG